MFTLHVALTSAGKSSPERSNGSVWTPSWTLITRRQEERRLASCRLNRPPSTMAGPCSMAPEMREEKVEKRSRQTMVRMREVKYMVLRENVIRILARLRDATSLKYHYVTG